MHVKNVALSFHLTKANLKNDSSRKVAALKLLSGYWRDLLSAHGIVLFPFSMETICGCDFCIESPDDFPISNIKCDHGTKMITFYKKSAKTSDSVTLDG